jgi:hypothetical protein
MRYLTLAFALIASACSVHVSDDAGSPPPVVTSSGMPIYQIATGASVTMQPGNETGFGITAGGGGNWRLVWTGDSAVSGYARELTGSISTAGRFTDLAPGCADGSCPLERNDTVGGVESTASGETVRFDAFATTGLDGVDFSVDSEPVTFDLFVDGVHQPQLVLFPTGRGDSSVASVPFSLQTL